MTSSAPERIDEAIVFTPAAAEHVRRLMEKRAIEGHALRIFISAGGCSGYQYGMAFEANARSEDHHFDSQGIEILVDPHSLTAIKGSRVDFVEDLMGGGFNIENPNAVASCGCGTSFRTDTAASTAAKQSSCNC